MSHRQILFFILGVDAFILLFQTSSLSISYYEAEILYGDLSFLQLLIQSSIGIFGNNDFALRFPMIVLHLLSVLLLYKVSKKYILDRRNRLWIVLVFVLLPGVVSSAIIVDTAGLIIFGLLLFVYIYENFSKKYVYMLLTSFILIDGGFLYLFLALAIFAIYTLQKNLFIFNIIAFFISIAIFGVEVKGSPSGHFLDVIAIYAVIFTPIIFIYIFYILYRRYLTKEIDVLWFIASIPFIISLLISFRQRLELEHFAPYLILALPLAAQTFRNSYRVRLKMFRSKYKLIFGISLILLILNTLVVLFNKELYPLIDNPRKHFVYKMHVAKELAIELKSRNINCVKTNTKMSDRLKFYGIGYCEENILLEKNLTDKTLKNVTISYKNRTVYAGNVTVINTN